MSNPAVPAVVVRDFQEEDRGILLGFTQDTWSWGDYVPGALDAWLEDPAGEVRVAETADGRPVGVYFYVEMPGGQSWLSGLRVDPRFRRRGVARAFLEDAIATAQRHGIHSLRFASEVNNEAIQKLSRGYGLKTRGTWLSFERVLDEAACRVGRGRPPQHASTSPLSNGDGPRIMSLLHASGHTLYARDWAWQELGLEAVQQLSESGGAFVSRSGMGGWGVVLITVQQAGRLEATLLGSDVSCALALLHVVQRRACEGQPGIRVLIHTPQLDAGAVLLATLARRGDWHPKMEHPLRIWEIELADRTD